MIDEYIVTTLSMWRRLRSALFPGRHHLRQHLLAREYGARVDAGQMGVVKRGDKYGFFAQMRYRFVTDLFGLRLDKARFRRDFGVPVEIGLGAEIAFMTMVGGIATNTREEITLTEHGRYLLLVMMPRRWPPVTTPATKRARAAA